MTTRELGLVVGLATFWCFDLHGKRRCLAGKRSHLVAELGREVAEAIAVSPGTDLNPNGGPGKRAGAPLGRRILPKP
jgi:hypothetical protein